jgi:hypothetical protein
MISSVVEVGAIFAVLGLFGVEMVLKKRLLA